MALSETLFFSFRLRFVLLLYLNSNRHNTGRILYSSSLTLNILTFAIFRGVRFNCCFRYLCCCKFFFTFVVFDLLVNYQVSSLFIFIYFAYLWNSNVRNYEHRKKTNFMYRTPMRMTDKMKAAYTKNTIILQRTKEPNKIIKRRKKKKNEAKKRDCLDEKSGFSSTSFAAALYFCFFDLLP